MTTQDNAQKFLLHELPDSDYLSQAYMIRTGMQGWLKKDAEHEVKVNGYPDDDEYFVTEKKTGSSGREKHRETISKEAFDILFSLTEGSRVHKKCWMFKDKDFAVRFDQFLDETTKGKIVMLEVDNLSGKECVLPELPWAIHAIDVTDDASYLNQNLAC